MEATKLIKKNGNITVGIECSNRANTDGTFSIFLKFTEDGKNGNKKLLAYPLNPENTSMLRQNTAIG